MPAIRSMFVFAKPAASNPGPGAVDFGRLMGAAVVAEDVVVEMLDAEAQPRNADFAERVNFGLGERARLAFERDFLGGVPRDVRPQAIDEPFELARAKKRGRAAAEIDEAKRPAAHHGQFADELDFARECGEVALDFGRILFGEDFEVAELAPLATKRNVQIEAERHARGRGVAARHEPRRAGRRDQAEKGG